MPDRRKPRAGRRRPPPDRARHNQAPARRRPCRAAPCPTDRPPANGRRSSGRPRRRPTCAAATTNTPASIARARISTCQCASPVGTVKAAGIERTVRPALLSAGVEIGEAQIVADRKAELADRRNRPRRRGRHRDRRRRFAPALAGGEIDVEQMDLVVARPDIAGGVDHEAAVGRAGPPLLALQRQRAEMDPDPRLCRRPAHRRQHRDRRPRRGDAPPPAPGRDRAGRSSRG